MTEATVVAVLFTDLVRSTELAAVLGAAGADELRREHFASLRECVARHHGREVKNTGDGLMVAFAGASDAAACAVDLQRAAARLARRRRDVDVAMRVGISLGEAVQEDDDLFGTPVVEAARLCAAAQPGTILASQLVATIAAPRAALRFGPPRPLTLKGLPDPVVAVEVAWEEAGPSDVPLPASLAQELPFPFVGRDEALESLRAAWKDVVAREHRRFAFVAGEPGIGKTRLAAEFARGARAEGAVVLHGRCDEEAPPYQPFAEAIAHLVAYATGTRLAGAVERHAAELARLVPRLDGAATPERSADPATVDADSARYRLFAAVESMLAEVSAERPVALVLDDLHWADRPSLQLLRHLARSSEPAAVMVVGTYRDTDLTRTHLLADLLADLRREPLVERLALRGLGGDDVAALLRVTVGHELGRRGRRLAEALFQETEGNPFFIGSILLHLVESGRVYQRDGIWTFDMAVEQLGIPQGIREVVGRRLSRLSDACNQVLASASVIGREFDVDVVGRMAALEEDALLAALDEASAAALIAEVGERKRATFAFTHALVRQTLYEELSLPRKQRLHARAAAAMEELPVAERDRHVGALASHFRQAGAAADPAKVLEWSLRAGAAAASVLAWEEAAAHLVAALEVMDDDPGAEDAARARLLQHLGDLMFVGGGAEHDRGIAYLERALGLYERLGDRHGAAQVHSRLGRALSSLPSEQPFDVNAAFEHYRAAEEVLSEGPARAALGYLHAGIATASTYALDVDRGLAAARRALEIGERLGNEGLYLGASAAYGWHLCATGRFAEGFRVLEESWARADAVDHAFAAFHLTSYRGGWAFGLGDIDTAAVWFERELRKPRTAQALRPRRSMLSMVIEIKLHQGDVRAARAAMEEASATPFAESMFAFYAGDWARARSLAAEVRDRFGEVGARWQAGYSSLWLGKAAYAAGDREAGERALRASVELSGVSVGNQLVTRAALGVRLAVTGAVAEAEEELRRCRELVGNGEDWCGSRGRVAVAEAAVAAARGDAAGAEAAAREAVDTLHRYGGHFEEAGAQRVWGWCLRRLGDEAAAAAHEERASALLREQGTGEPWHTGEAESDALALVLP